MYIRVECIPPHLDYLRSTNIFNILYLIIMTVIVWYNNYYNIRKYNSVILTKTQKL